MVGVSVGVARVGLVAEGTTGVAEGTWVGALVGVWVGVTPAGLVAVGTTGVAVGIWVGALVDVHAARIKATTTTIADNAF